MTETEKKLTAALACACWHYVGTVLKAPGAVPGWATEEAKVAALLGTTSDLMEKMLHDAAEDTQYWLDLVKDGVKIAEATIGKEIEMKIETEEEPDHEHEH